MAVVAGVLAVVAGTLAEELLLDPCQGGHAAEGAQAAAWVNASSKEYLRRLVAGGPRGVKGEGG